MHRLFKRQTAASNKQLSLVRFACLALLGGLGLLAATGASANPSIQEKRAQAEAILEGIAALDAEVGAAAERFNGANYELQKLTSELRETRRDLARARRQQMVSRKRLEARLVQLYVNGDTGSTVEIMLGARDLDDMIEGIETAQRVAAQDASIAHSVKVLRQRIARRERDLASARTRQSAVVQQRAAEKGAIEAKLDERQRLLASVKDEIARLEEAEQRRQAELRRRAELELARQRRLADVQQRAQQAQAADAESADPSPQTGEPSFTEEAAPPEASPPVPSPADASRGAQVVAIAMQYLGIPYKWGGASPETGFDCSGFTMYVFAKIGVSLPHYAAAQYGMGSAVSKDQLQPGDLVFFRGLGHMGMYVGGGNFIHAPHTGDVVKISSLSESYYVANWVGARRVL